MFRMIVCIQPGLVRIFCWKRRRVGEWLNQFLTAKGIENANVVNIRVDDWGDGSDWANSWP